MEGVKMKRALFWGTLLAGAVAAYMMYRRGESLGMIAAHAVINPVGSLVTELRTASS
jgi:membrane protease YdiL (CAAX protease family)